MYTIPTLPKIILLVVFLFVGLVAYFVPSIIAVKRDHHNRAPIMIVNILLGWSFIGWVVALAWSLSQTPPKCGAV
jgi:cytochrome c biogenesis protein CcdA